ncbi:MAG: 3-deoxy-D-manno-octulosonic acid transferase [Acidobacteriota bacterium]
MAPPALWVYRTLLRVALTVTAPWLLLEDRRRRLERPPLSQRLGWGLPPLPRDGLWIQAVSVGEVAVARPLLLELRRRHPELPLILSSTTATGIATAVGHRAADVVVPFPVDLPGPVRRCLDAARPRLVVLVETELWPELLASCGARGIPVVLVNARISDSSYRGYRAGRFFLQPLLRPVTLVLAQGDEEATRLAALGIPREKIRVTGNIKFDAAPARPAPPELIERLRALAAGRPILVAGSTMAGEEQAVLGAVSRLPADLQPFLLIAPRHPDRGGDVLRLAQVRGLQAARRTCLEAASAACRVVLLDTVGELAALYELATVAFVGGSLVKSGGHNPIEPARFGVPVLSGPHIRNFASVYQHFLAEGAARIVRDERELADALTAWSANPATARRAGEAGRQLLLRHSGATARNVDALEAFLS